MSETILNQIQRVVSARAKAPDFIALTDEEYRALLREVAPLCPLPGDGGGDSIWGIPIVMTGSHAHQLRMLRGDVGIKLNEGQT